jgi:hypothetical protein
MEIWLKAYCIVSGLILVYLFIDNFRTRGNVEALKEVNQKLRDKWAQTEALCRKLEAVAMWYVDRKNMAIENTGSWVTPWIVVAKQDPNEIAKLSDAWAAMYAHREELAQAIYDANLKAMRAFAEEKKAVRRAKK